MCVPSNSAADMEQRSVKRHAGRAAARPAWVRTRGREVKRGARGGALLRPRLAFHLQDLAAAFLPFHVEGALLVRALVGVAAEVVALGLNDVAGEPAAAERVVVGEAGAVRGGGDAVLDADV